MEEEDNIIVKWAQEDVETSYSLLNNNNNNNNNYYYYYYYYVKNFYVASFITFFAQAVPLDMYVFYTSTHVKQWDVSPYHICVIILFHVFQPDNDHIWPTHVANLTLIVLMWRIG